MAQDVAATPPAPRRGPGQRVVLYGIFVLVALVALYFFLPKLAGLNDTWRRIEDGSPAWIILGLLLTFGMFAGYVAMFRGAMSVLRDPSSGISLGRDRRAQLEQVGSPSWASECHVAAGTGRCSARPGHPWAVSPPWSPRRGPSGTRLGRRRSRR